MLISKQFDIDSEVPVHVLYVHTHYHTSNLP